MEYPLIEIQSVPISLKMKVTDAKLEYSRGTADLEISRESGGLNIKSRAIRVNIDTFEARNTIRPTTARAIQQNAQKGQQAAYEATATYARQGQLLLETRIGQELVTQFATEAVAQDITPINVEFLPGCGPEINWDPGQMQISYEMDKLNFDWKMNSAHFTFTPGDIEITVEQMPEVTIKYVGGPLYVPPSSDPNYEPVDVQA